MNLTNKCHLITRKIYFFLVTQLGLLFSIIFVLPLFSVMYIYRITIGILVPLFDETVVRITSGMTAVIACESEELSTSPAANTLSCMTFKGVIDMESFTKDFSGKVVNLSSEGDLLFPQFRQYFKRILGYTFYKWEANFVMSEHVREYITNTIVNEDSLAHVCDELVREPFKDQKSPWELVFLYKYKHSEDTSSIPKTVVFLRYSHALADAFSMITAVSYKLMPQKEVETKKSEKTKRKPENQVLTLIKTLWFVLSGGLLYTFSNLKDNFGNGWLIETPNRKINRVRVNPVPVEQIRTIMETNQIGYTPVIIAAMTGGIRKYMIEKNMPIPSEIHMALPVVLPRKKSFGLTNKVSATIVELPIGTADSVERMKRIQRNYSKMINIPLPKIFPILTTLMGCIPSGVLLKMAYSKKRLSLLGTLVPGPSSALWYKDHELEIVVAAGGFGRDNNGFGAAFLSYNKMCSISVGLDTAVVKQYSDAKKVVKLIRQEFYSLNNSVDLV